jgi:competence ComEA-like helix-hairpin-helix protein
MRIRTLAPADAALATMLLLVLVLFAFRGAVMEEESGFAVPSLVKPEPDLEHRVSALVDSLRVNPNQADALRLTAVPGVGEALAQAIVRFREAHGAFRRLSDLREVPGIGPKRLQDLLPYLTLEEEARWSTK